jgi:hypothetical protein
MEDAKDTKERVVAFCCDLCDLWKYSDSEASNARVLYRNDWNVVRLGGFFLVEEIPRCTVREVVF